MARVLKRVARKDYPEHGIKKGDTYYKVSLKTGPRSSRTLKSLTPFKRWQLTTSDYLQRVYRLADETIRNIKGPDDFESLKQEVEELKNEQQEKLDNMPEQLAQASQVQERYDELEAFEQHLEGIDFEDDESYPKEDYDSYDAYVEAKIEEIESDCPF